MARVERMSSGTNAATRERQESSERAPVDDAESSCLELAARRFLSQCSGQVKGAFGGGTRFS